MSTEKRVCPLCQHELDAVWLDIDGQLPIQYYCRNLITLPSETKLFHYRFWSDTGDAQIILLPFYLDIGSRGWKLYRWHQYSSGLQSWKTVTERCPPFEWTTSEQLRNK